MYVREKRWAKGGCEECHQAELLVTLEELKKAKGDCLETNENNCHLQKHVKGKLTMTLMDEIMK